MIYLGWIVSKVKAVAPALPANDATTSNPSINEGLPKAPGGSMGIPSAEQATTKRRRNRTKPTPSSLTGSTAAPTKDDDDEGSSKGDDSSKAIVKRFIRAFMY